MVLKNVNHLNQRGGGGGGGSIQGGSSTSTVQRESARENARARERHTHTHTHTHTHARAHTHTGAVSATLKYSSPRKRALAWPCWIAVSPVSEIRAGAPPWFGGFSQHAIQRNFSNVLACHGLFFQEGLRRGSGIYIHTYIQMYVCLYVCIHLYACTHTHTHTHTHKHTHTHMGSSVPHPLTWTQMGAMYQPG